MMILREAQAMTPLYSVLEMGAMWYPIARAQIDWRSVVIDQRTSPLQNPLLIRMNGFYALTIVKTRSCCVGQVSTWFLLVMALSGLWPRFRQKRLAQEPNSGMS